MHDFLVALARKIGVLKIENPARGASFEKVKTPPNGSLQYFEVYFYVL